MLCSGMFTLNSVLGLAPDVGFYKIVNRILLCYYLSYALIPLLIVFEYDYELRTNVFPNLIP
jgi:hypothetical protein